MEPFDRIGPYELICHLGSGATAEVWRAHHRTLQVPRALKFLTHSSPDAQRRMLSEARVQATVRHPNVITVHDIFEYQGRPVIAQDLVDGTDLEAWIELEPEPDALVSVLADALEGLAALHEAGIVHRDLKPSNLMIDVRGRTQIADFGLARQGPGNGTRTGALLGTPAFMAPEQGDDATLATEQSDLFSIGCVALYLVCKRSVFQRETVRETLLAVHDCDAVLADLDLDGFDPTLARVLALIRATVRRDPEARVQSCAEALQVLARPSRQAVVPVRSTLPPTETAPSLVRSEKRTWLLGTLGAVTGGAAMGIALLIIAAVTSAIAAQVPGTQVAYQAPVVPMEAVFHDSDAQPEPEPDPPTKAQQKKFLGLFPIKKR